jgi:hypothetical protein
MIWRRFFLMAYTLSAVINAVQGNVAASLFFAAIASVLYALPERGNR